MTDTNAQPNPGYSEPEFNAVVQHIRDHFGPFEKSFRDTATPDYPIDIAIVPPTTTRNCLTLVTVGSGARRMNVPAQLAEHELERAEFAIDLPASWNLDDLSSRDNAWPIMLLTNIARMAATQGTFTMVMQTVGPPNNSTYAENTKLGATMIIPSQGEDGASLLRLPGGEAVNFYHLFPMTLDELEYGLKNGKDALLQLLAYVSSVVDPNRPSAVPQKKKGFFGRR